MLTFEPQKHERVNLSLHIFPRSLSVSQGWSSEIMVEKGCDGFVLICTCGHMLAQTSLICFFLFTPFPWPFCQLTFVSHHLEGKKKQRRFFSHVQDYLYLNNQRIDSFDCRLVDHPLPHPPTHTHTSHPRPFRKFCTREQDEDGGRWYCHSRARLR